MAAARRVYLDYNATAPVRPEVQAAVTPLLFGEPAAGAFGNASSIHWAGRAARKHLERARATVATRFARKASEVLFTSGGTEADNLALFGVLLHPAEKRKRLVVSAVEHPAVLAAAHRLRELGVEVVTIPVDGDGRLDLDALEAALRVPTALVSVMAVNNETGVCAPVAEVVRRARAAGAWVHVDAVQAAGRLPLPVEADLIALSGHKLGALKGSGALVIRDQIPLRAEVVGGPQERGRRAGTEPVPQAVALATALELAEVEREHEAARLGALRDALEAALLAIPHTRILGRGAPRIAGTVAAVFPGLEGDSLLQALDLAGFAASSGSACSSGSLEPSHVLLAMGVPREEALGAVRFSLGWGSQPCDVTQLVETLPDLVAQLRGP
jgi:cysteine desulfurase